jgi:hypothetical protein
MKPVLRACLALVLLAVPAPAFAFGPLSVLVSALASAAAGAAGGAALSSAGIGVAGQAVTAPPGTGSIQPSGVRPQPASPRRKARQSGRAKHANVVRRSP